MKDSETLKALQKLEVDCLYNKNTHFNAARRVHHQANRYKYFLIFGSIFASFSTIMNVGVWDKIATDTTYIQVIVNILGALGGFFILFTTVFSDYHSKMELSNKHENVGITLNLLHKKLRLLEVSFQDELISNDKMLEKLEELSIEYTSVCSSAPITIEKDYQKSRENFKKGYSNYTKEELES